MRGALAAALVGLAGCATADWSPSSDSPGTGADDGEHGGELADAGAVDGAREGTPDAAAPRTVTIDVKQVGNNVWRGWWGLTSGHFPANDNTFAGDANDLLYNAYFVFALPGGSVSRIDALDLELEIETYHSANQATEMITVWDVSAAADEVENLSTSATIYHDLMGGKMYGSRVVSAGDHGAVISIPLGADAATDAQLAFGKDFVVGVHHATSPGWLRFSVGSEPRTHRLRITYTP